MKYKNKYLKLKKSLWKSYYNKLILLLNYD
jgi:hypothetical protein